MAGTAALVAGLAAAELSPVRFELFNESGCSGVPYQTEVIGPRPRVGTGADVTACEADGEYCQRYPKDTFLAPDNGRWYWAGCGDDGMYFCRTASPGDCNATYGLYEDDPGFSGQRKDHNIPAMIVCFNPATGGPYYAEFNQSFGVNNTVGCTQLQQAIWARLTCLEPPEVCEGPGDGSTGDEGLSGMELGLAIGGGVAGGIALVGTVAYMTGCIKFGSAAAATIGASTALFAGRKTTEL